MQNPSNNIISKAIVRTADLSVLGVSSPGFLVFVVIYDIIFPVEK